MPARVEAPITPRVFAWARNSAGYTVEQVAKRVGRPAEVVEQWEKGKARPTFSQAKLAAEMFARPVALLFLSEQPEERTLTSFRTLPESEGKPQGPSLRYFARRVVERCEWAAEVRRGRGEAPRDFVGAATLRDNPADLAGKIREQLGIVPGVWSKADSKAAARRDLAGRIRDAGIFVFSTDYIPARAVPIEEMRGLAVCEPLAPAVAYNRNDFGAGAQIFTLAHEMAHLWLGKRGEGVSSDWPLGQGNGNEAKVERFCNRVAGEVLMPRDWFCERWLQANNAEESVGKKMEDIARFLCVSRGAAAYQAAACGLIEWNVYERLHKQYKREARGEPRRGDAFALPRGKMLLAQSGRDFAALVLSVYYDGGLRPMEAAELLGARRHEHVDAIAREILG